MPEKVNDSGFKIIFPFLMVSSFLRLSAFFFMPRDGGKVKILMELLTYAQIILDVWTAAKL